MFTLEDFKSKPQENVIPEPPIDIEPGTFSDEKVFEPARKEFAKQMERIFKKEFQQRLDSIGVKDFSIKKAILHTKKHHPQLLKDAIEIRKDIDKIYHFYMKKIDTAFRILFLIMDYYKTEELDTPELPFTPEIENLKPVNNFPDCKYLYITEPEKLCEVINNYHNKNLMGIDLETTGLDPYTNEIRLIQIAVTGEPVLIIDLFKISRENLKPLEELFQNCSVKVFQNGKFDLKFLTKNKFKVDKVYFDTMLAAKLLEAGEPNYKGKYRLNSIVKRYLNQELPKEQQTSNWSKEDLSEDQLLYAARDSQILLNLYEVLINRLEKEKLLEAAELEFNILPAVVEMELTGIYLDKTKMKALTKKIHKDLKQAEKDLLKELEPALEKDLFGAVNINLNSHQQLLPALKKLGIKLLDTSEESLKRHIDKSPIQALLNYRKLSKAYTTYSLECYKPHINPVTGRIHPEYHQMTSAGRFSCKNPNLQQVPRIKEYRDCFRAEKDNVICCSDYSQIELRTAAEISRDKTMIEAYQDNKDLHKLTASLVTGKSLEDITKEERQMSKALNFGLIFGMSAKGLAVYAKNSYGVNMSEKDAENFKTKFFRAYKGINRWHNKTKRDKAYEIRTLSGRRRKWSRKEDFYLTTRLNSPIQGTAADILKKALCLLPEALENTGAKIIGTVHDEILLECPSARAEEVSKILQATMETAGRVYLKQVPVISEPAIGNSWADTK